MKAIHFKQESRWDGFKNESQLGSYLNSSCQIAMDDKWLQYVNSKCRNVQYNNKCKLQKQLMNKLLFKANVQGASFITCR